MYNQLIFLYKQYFESKIILSPQNNHFILKYQIIIIIIIIVMKTIRKLLQKPYPQFRNLSPLDIPIGLMGQYNSQVFWTPRYQKIPFTESLLRYLRYLQRSNTVGYPQHRQFVEHLLTDYHTVMKEDRPNYNIMMGKDVNLGRTNACPYHGKVDWVFSANGFNMVPVLFEEREFNPCAGIAMALYNMYFRLNMKQALQKQLKPSPEPLHANSYGSSNIHGYSILTTGNEWQIIRIDRNYLLEKSLILEGRNQYRSMYADEDMVTTVLGMFDYCLDLPNMNVQVLEKSYQYLEERRWMLEGVDDEEIRKASWLSKVLLKHYRKKF